uniref:snRNA-activating protein complex subunit 4 n=1 Tax=Rousettus aegyptiacus TaxID=9407 RepID=A0A7J8ITK2_ROUAE|nr:small nuclear RNA activating complex polypeptide 4 [Rousettus aegyptiacus]
MDIDAEREKIAKEIKELERILDPCSSSINVEVSDSSLESDSDADSPPDEDSDAAGPPISEEERWGDVSNDEDDTKEKTLPEDPETCLQLNMVYQEVVQEKLAEVSLLLAQNREQQEGVLWDLAGSKGPKVKDGKSLPPNLYIGHFMKPYFKDRVTGVGPPANEDARDKAAQGIKAFEALLVTKWKHWEKALLRKSVVSDRLQRLLQPKLLKLEYLQQKRSRVASEAERRALEKQSREAEREIQEINQLPEEALLGSRLDSHDWEKISNMSFEGSRSAGQIQKFWQNWEHPSVNKQEWSGQEVRQLKALAAQHGHLEWQRVAEELGTGRSAFQCLQKFQQHNTALKRKEWTEQEDRMLTQLVQEMRVGSHIPYRKIVYYMEGRDSMQLIYRWTKSLDPSLKKGFWAPEEDAKLLQAVTKYGEQDWFKIRAEVPGRSDAQCRDRYLRRLHSSLKKGRWTPKEEEKLAELIEKHGVGHWAKIASELPQRSGSQCLSKWKVMVRKQQRRGRGRRRPLRTVRWSSSSGDSDGDSGGDSSSGSSKEDSEPEPEPEEAPEAQEGGRVLPSAWHSVPDVDLWIPARQGADRLWGGGAGGLAASPSPPAGSRGGSRAAGATARAPTERAGQAQAPSATHSAAVTDVGNPRSEHTPPSSSEGPADESGTRLLKGPPETAPQVLSKASDTGCRLPAEEPRQPCPSSSAQGTGPGGRVLVRRCARQWPRGHALHRRPLERRLLVAVSPWAGDVLPCLPRRPAVAHTRADSIRARLQDARLASTPVFALLIQLFQIDTAGCMEVVRERKARLATLPPAGAQEPLRQPPQVPPRARSSTGTPPTPAVRRGRGQASQALALGLGEGPRLGPVRGTRVAALSWGRGSAWGSPL